MCVYVFICICYTPISGVLVYVLCCICTLCGGMQVKSHSPLCRLGAAMSSAGCVLQCLVRVEYCSVYCCSVLCRLSAAVYDVVPPGTFSLRSSPRRT